MARVTLALLSDTSNEEVVILDEQQLDQEVAELDAEKAELENTEAVIEEAEDSVETMSKLEEIATPENKEVVAVVMEHFQARLGTKSNGFNVSTESSTDGMKTRIVSARTAVEAQIEIAQEGFIGKTKDFFSRLFTTRKNVRTQLDALKNHKEYKEGEFKPASWSMHLNLSGNKELSFSNAKNSMVSIAKQKTIISNLIKEASKVLNEVEKLSTHLATGFSASDKEKAKEALKEITNITDKLKKLDLVTGNEVSSGKYLTSSEVNTLIDLAEKSLDMNSNEEKIIDEFNETLGIIKYNFKKARDQDIILNTIRYLFGSDKEYNMFIKKCYIILNETNKVYSHEFKTAYAVAKYVKASQA